MTFNRPRANTRHWSRVPLHEGYGSLPDFQNFSYTFLLFFLSSGSLFQDWPVNIFVCLHGFFRCLLDSFVCPVSCVVFSTHCLQVFLCCLLDFFLLSSVSLVQRLTRSLNSFVCPVSPVVFSARCLHGFLRCFTYFPPSGFLFQDWSGHSIRLFARFTLLSSRLAVCTFSSAVFSTFPPFIVIIIYTSSSLSFHMGPSPLWIQVLWTVCRIRLSGRNRTRWTWTMSDLVPDITTREYCWSSIPALIR